MILNKLQFYIIDKKAPNNIIASTNFLETNYNITSFVEIHQFLKLLQTKPSYLQVIYKQVNLDWEIHRFMIEFYLQL